MAIATTYKVMQMKYKTSENGKDRVIKAVYLRTIKTDGEYSVDRDLMVHLSTPDWDNYIEYGDVTEENAIEWALANQSDKKKANEEAHLLARLEKVKNPPLPADGSSSVSEDESEENFPWPDPDEEEE